MLNPHPRPETPNPVSLTLTYNLYTLEQQMMNLDSNPRPYP